jgi:hypothetical protein
MSDDKKNRVPVFDGVSPVMVAGSRPATPPKAPPPCPAPKPVKTPK